MSRPTVSVLVPTFDRADLLPETIESVLAQTHADLELVIVDDGSTDHTRALVAAVPDPRVRCVPLPHTGSLPRVRNAAFGAARGEYLALLDSDDLWEPAKLAAQVEALDRHPEAGYSFTGWETFDATGIVEREHYDAVRAGATAMTVAKLQQTLLSGRIVVYPSTLVIRREVADKVGRMREDLVTSDYEYLARVAATGPGAVLHSRLARIRKHPGNLSRIKGAEGYVEALAAVDRAYERGELPREVWVDRTLQYRYRLGKVRQAEGARRTARAEFAACTRARARELRPWLRWASTFVPLRLPPGRDV